MTLHFETDTAILTRPIEPPPFCDLAWHSAGGAIFTADPTPLYEAAVTRAMGGMERTGFDLRADRVTLDLSRCRDIAKLEKQFEIWTRVARAELVTEEERAAARRPLGDEVIAEVQEGLCALLDEVEWAFNKRVDIAREFAYARTMTRRQYDWARDILSGARSAVAAVDARLATEAGADAMERAYDVDVREALHAACRHLSDLDEDRCQEANGQGWGAVTSAAGHRLAGLESLTVLQAAHAWSIVHPHRRQLPDDLRKRLFGNAL
ncbi:hypothetical protein G3T14_15415 [Methylobacterium sp. BTF04]|uniref:hypothetical protein n=1 Tax=Methylobacterium sp. BTF04 TaxID=2708300 RepID=UPI0013D2E3A4|nr:hypothetical protein [Methylobacterium sp. BTF04]NEU13510.1 hypothetical protein [Methylobacterium sp. BTF04]